MDHHDLDAALAEMQRVLGPRTGDDWTVPAGPLDWTCRQTAAHIAHDLLAYAGQLAAQPADAYLPIDLHVRPTAPPAEVLQAVAACGGLLSSALVTADPTVRAWHWGPCDPSGFAAMGVAEILLHTHDITRGLSVDWLPPVSLSAAVLDRLFPAAPLSPAPPAAALPTAAPSGDPVRVLLWCTGRGELDGLPRQTSWSWQAARPE
ncbi:maleylpyruvate isomerase N-terminal domain-containing protein [Streptomyces sp. NPDC004539]|uniref:maleylpyruvate isomerase N-terminal domain-containing protein n=1 Tax=Streptomyces sp. NPDC004539 TaxID=3154280 RepID=UPI0033A92EC3